MNKEAILKVAEEVLYLQRIEKFSAVSRQYLKDHYQEINKAYIKYINEKTFPKGNTKVPYNDLDTKYKELVWNQFLTELEKKLSPVEQQVETVIDLMKPKVEIIEDLKR